MNSISDSKIHNLDKFYEKKLKILKEKVAKIKIKGNF